MSLVPLSSSTLAISTILYMYFKSVVDMACQLGDAARVKAGNGGTPVVFHVVQDCSISTGHQGGSGPLLVAPFFS